MRKSTKRPGLTLIEVAVALGILSIAIAAAGAMFETSGRALRGESEASAASVLAQQIIADTVRVTPSGSPVSTTWTTDPAAGNLQWKVTYTPLPLPTGVVRKLYGCNVSVAGPATAMSPGASPNVILTIYTMTAQEGKL